MKPKSKRARFQVGQVVRIVIDVGPNAPVWGYRRLHSRRNIDGDKGWLTDNGFFEDKYIYPLRAREIGSRRPRRKGGR